MNETLTRPAEPLPKPSSASGANARLRRVAVVAALLVIVGTVAGLVPRWQRRAALRAETRELAIQTVSLVSLARGQAVAGLALPAEVKPFLESPIYARASGYLRRWLADIGAQVKEGELLAEIDTPELDQELAQSRAQLARAQAALALARTTAARWTELLKTASVSEQETAEKQADLELQSAGVQAAQANVRRLEQSQSFQSVKAPFAGTITARNTDVGELIAAGNGKELFRLAQTRTLRVYVAVPQSAAAGVAPGQKAELSIPELHGRVFPAKVVRTSGAMTAGSRTLLTELEVDNSRGEILAGSFAQVRLAENKSALPLTLPANTLLFRSEGTQVGVVGVDGKVELRGVTLGRDFGPTIEILDGVGPNDRVILNPADSLVNGAVVRVADAKGRR
ncbi:MAG TPA: efflux RND transporter periplasmic adaptor subunit [Dongiaceae bacterium]|nr:efflux RND transporter periplasmic adaptor subunit [Dongiaceae bacterium]